MSGPKIHSYNKTQIGDLLVQTVVLPQSNGPTYYETLVYDCDRRGDVSERDYQNPRYCLLTCRRENVHTQHGAGIEWAIGHNVSRFHVPRRPR